MRAAVNLGSRSKKAASFVPRAIFPAVPDDDSFGVPAPCLIAGRVFRGPYPLDPLEGWLHDWAGVAVVGHLGPPGRWFVDADAAAYLGALLAAHAGVSGRAARGRPAGAGARRSAPPRRRSRSLGTPAAGPSLPRAPSSAPASSVLPCSKPISWREPLVRVPGPLVGRARPVAAQHRPALPPRQPHPVALVAAGGEPLVGEGVAELVG